MLPEPILETRNLKKYFPLTGGMLSRKIAEVKAVDGVDLSVSKGETLALVGESGCGKSTLARCIVRLLDPTAGSIYFKSADITRYDSKAMKLIRGKIQMVFQDPYASLDPRMKIETAIGALLKLHKGLEGKERREAVSELLRLVGLSESHIDRFPHQFSGGERQRVGIARALATSPDLIVADEPVSSLDVSMQAQILNLMMDLQDRVGLTYLFITHELGVVRHIGDRIAVMYLGKIVELATKEEFFSNPLHPYTISLLNASPIPDPLLAKRKRQLLIGEPTSAIDPPSGCRFHTRCPRAMSICSVEEPKVLERGKGHFVSCHLYN